DVESADALRAAISRAPANDQFLLDPLLKALEPEFSIKRNRREAILSDLQENPNVLKAVESGRGDLAYHHGWLHGPELTKAFDENSGYYHQEPIFGDNRKLEHAKTRFQKIAEIAKTQIESGKKVVSFVLGDSTHYIALGISSKGDIMLVDSARSYCFFTFEKR